MESSSNLWKKTPKLTELQPIGAKEANIKKEHRVKRSERKQSVSEHPCCFHWGKNLLHALYTSERLCTSTAATGSSHMTHNLPLTQKWWRTFFSTTPLSFWRGNIRANQLTSIIQHHMMFGHETELYSNKWWRSYKTGTLLHFIII